MATTTMTQPTTTRSAWRSVGLWFTGLLMAYMIFNTFRATLSPAAFTETFGIPISDPAGLWFVLVYASRALFLGLFGGLLLITRQYRILEWYALVAVVMPIGDALVVMAAGAAPTVALRHVLIALFLVLTWWLVRRWNRSQAA